MADRIRASSEWLDKCARDLRDIENAINSAGRTLGSVELRRDEGGNLRASLSCSLRMNGARFSANNAADDIRQLERAASALTGATASFSGGIVQAARIFENAENKAREIIMKTNKGDDSETYQSEDQAYGDSNGRGDWFSDTLGAHAKGYPNGFAAGTDPYGIPERLSFGDLGFFVPFLGFNPETIRKRFQGAAGNAPYGEAAPGAEAGDAEETLKIFGIPMGVSGAVVAGSVSHTENVLGFLNVTGTAEGDVLGFSTKTYNGKWKTSEKDGKIDSGATVGMELEGHLAQGKHTFDVNGLLHREIKGTVGSVSAEGTAGVTLYKDGKLSPALQAKLKAEAVGLKGSIEDRVGTEDYNYHAKASGSVGVAKAEASVGLGRITYTDKEGNQHTEWGAQAKAGAEAYVAEGKVSGGYTIMGIKVDVGVSGKIGGAGASAGGQATTSGFSGKAGLGAGVGAGIEINVDWSGFKPPKLPSIKLPNLKLPKFKLF